MYGKTIYVFKILDNNFKNVYKKFYKVNCLKDNGNKGVITILSVNVDQTSPTVKAASIEKLTNGTKDINKAVKRNIERFPEDFCFKLTLEEYNILKSQIATSNIIENIHSRGGKQKLPYVFTEKGIIMLSGLLKSNIAAKVNIQILYTL